MELYPVVAGDLSGSMDRTVFYKVDDRCLGRKKAMPKERDFSDVEKEQHLKFGFTGKLGSRLRYVLKETLLHVPKYLSAANYFVRLNIGNCMVEDLDSGLVTFDYEHTVFAEGSLIVPNVEASYLEESNSFSFTLTPIEGREFPGKLKSDKVNVVLVESNLLQAYQLELGTRGTEASITEVLEPGWNKDNVHLYAYAIDKDGKDTSPSVYLPLV